jgi:hypothetical protein
MDFSYITNTLIVEYEIQQIILQRILYNILVVTFRQHEIIIDYFLNKIHCSQLFSQ